jgi:hypothetical protein
MGGKSRLLSMTATMGLALAAASPPVGASHIWVDELTPRRREPGRRPGPDGLSPAKRLLEQQRRARAKA